MTQEMTTTSLKQIFRFPFEEPGWQGTFLVGVAVTLAGFFIPLLPSLFTMGYVLAVMQQAARGQTLTLPAWDDLGQKALDGLQGFLVSLAYMLPGALIFYGGMMIYMVASLFMPFLFTFFMGPGEEAAIGIFFASMALFFITFLLMFLSIFAGMFVLFLGLIPLPAAFAQLAAHGQLSDAFRLRRIWALLKANALGYFVAWVVTMGLFAMLYLVIILAYSSLVFCVLIPVLMAPIGFYLQLVWAALFGHTYHESVLLASEESAA